MSSRFDLGCIKQKNKQALIRQLEAAPKAKTVTKMIQLKIRHIFFSTKMYGHFSDFSMKTYVEYSLEAPHQGTSKKYPQCMFSWRNQKNNFLDIPLIWIYEMINIFSLTQTIMSMTKSLIFHCYRWPSHKLLQMSNIMLKVH